LMQYFKDRCTDFMDVLTEEFAEQRDKPRSAIMPNVVQHVG
jgi:hypothetical protein